MITQRREAFFVAVIVLILSLISVIGGRSNSPAFAEASEEIETPVYSNVMDDLKSDETFDPDEYPQNDDDNSLNVIQIAESTDKELFIYVYQPSGDYRSIKASSINIAKETDNSLNLKFDNYPLTYINSSGVFYKYKVENFELTVGAVRYYNISQIMRPFEYMFDDPPSSGTISETPCPVGQLWTAITLGDIVQYSMTASEVIEITQKYVGFLQYVDGITVGGVPGMYGTITGNYTVRNFVAFSPINV